MSSSDFVHIANRTGSGKADRLFRASVSAFCALPRPTRREIAQLDDLVLPLFDVVSPSSRRFVAACLSEMSDAPSGLLRRLVDEPVQTSAPLIIRSPKLSDIDLIALIGKHGLPHARAIGRRPNLNPAIASLVRALQRRSSPNEVAGVQFMPDQSITANVQRDEPPSPKAGPESAMSPAESVRRRLQAMMLPSQVTTRKPGMMLPVEHVPRGTIFARLRTTALTGNPAYFQTALADALGVDFRLARGIVESEAYGELILALKALDLDTEEAFMLAAAAFPRRCAHPEGIRLFVERYEQCHPEAARERLLGWKADSLASSMDAAGKSSAPRGTNANQPAPEKGMLKAS